MNLSKTNSRYQLLVCLILWAIAMTLPSCKKEGLSAAENSSTSKSKTPAGKTTPDPIPVPPPPSTGSYYPIMSASVAGNVTIYVEPNVPAQWVDAVNHSILNWNSVESSIKITRVYNAADAKISVKYEDIDIVEDQLVVSYEPTTDGNPGDAIYINARRDIIYTTSYLQEVTYMTRGIGWTFGFQKYGLYPNNPPLMDPGNQILNYYYSLAWDGLFKNDDMVAIDFLFPKPSLDPAALIARFMKYTNGSNHRYTIHKNIYGAGTPNNSYKFDGLAGYLYTLPVNGTVPLYQFYIASIGGSIYTTNYNEGAKIGTGGTIAGYVYQTQVPGSRPLYQYYNGTHRYYTTNPNDTTIDTGYWYEKVACYVL